MTTNANGNNTTLQNSSSRNPPQHGFQTYIKDHHAAQCAEITKFLKHNYTIPHDNKYKCEHLVRKTSRLRVAATDPDQWEHKFARRNRHLTEGFFTPQHKPYRSIGNVELNPHRLVLEVFSDGLNKKAPLPPVITGKFPSKLPQAETTVSTGKAPAESQNIQGGGNLDFTSADIETAGYTFIQENLGDYKQVLVANRGGQAYEKCVKEIEALKKEQSQEVDSNPTLTFKRPWTPSQGDKGLLVPVAELHSIAISTLHDPNKKCSKASAIEEDLEAERERMIYNRTRRSLIERLRAIQMIINALHNIRARDLRSRVPLSLEMVKMLFRDVVTEKPGVHRQLRQELQHESNDTVNSGDVKGHLGKNQSKASILKKEGTDGSISTTPTPQWRRFRQTLATKKPELRVETWEDLLALYSPGGHHRHSMFTTPGGMNMAKWIAPAGHGNPWKLPLWQSVAFAAEDSVKRTIPTHHKSAKHTHDPESTIKSLQENFVKVKKKMAREVQSDLERLFRDRMRTFRQKFHVINQSPLFERTVQNLKDVSAAQPVPVITDDENIEIKPSKWFLDLKSQVENTVGKEDAEVNKLIQQLSRFSLEDAKSIPNAKEKLCLLMMSMPASQLLTIQVQEALKFVLEEILWAPSECLQQWLQNRKIPVVLYSPTSASI